MDRRGRAELISGRKFHSPEPFLLPHRKLTAAPLSGVARTPQDDLCVSEILWTPSSSTPKLDFIHWEAPLNAERQVCKLLLTLVPKEGRKVDYACHSDALDCTICPFVVQAGVG